MFEMQAKPKTHPNYSLIDACIMGDLQSVFNLIESNKHQNTERLNKEKLPLVGNLWSPSPTNLLQQFLNQRNENNYTPLHAAVCYGHSLILDYLINQGADVAAVEDRGYNALHMAVKTRHHELLAQLLELKIDPNCKGEYGRTPLHFAAYDGCAKSTYYLLKAQCKVDVKTHKQIGGETPLQMAVYRGHKDVVTLLMMNGADCRTRNKNGDTIIKVALDGNNPEILKSLLDGFLYILNKQEFKEAYKLLKSLVRTAHSRNQIPMLLIFKEHQLTSLLFSIMEATTPELQEFMKKAIVASQSVELPVDPDKLNVPAPPPLSENNNPQNIDSKNSSTTTLNNNTSISTSSPIAPERRDLPEPPRPHLELNPSNNDKQHPNPMGLFASKTEEVVSPPPPPPLPVNLIEVTKEPTITDAPEKGITINFLSELQDSKFKLKPVDNTKPIKELSLTDMLHEQADKRRKFLEDKQIQFNAIIKESSTLSDDKEWDDTPSQSTPSFRP